MSEPLSKRKRKNPLHRTRQVVLPPAARSRKAHELTRAAAEGRFALQCCEVCGHYAYPAREACPHCLSADLPLKDAPDTGVLVSETTVLVPSDTYFRERAPWRIGLVKLDCGPVILSHLHADCCEHAAVRVSLQLDKAGQAVFFSSPQQGAPSMTDDRQGRELAADPRHRRVLIVDGRSPFALPLAKGLKAAGAAEIFIGLSEPWKPFAERGAFEALGGVSCVPLDVTDETSVRNLAADYGAKVEILINNTDFIRPGSILDAAGLNPARDAMERLVFGTMRLSQAFAPILQARGADGEAGAAAWVNILSIFGEATAPGLGTYSAAQAAALSLSHSLRSELGAGGVRLLNVLSGPTETEWFQALPAPKVAPKAVADAVIDGLKRGLEEVYVGDVAKDLHARHLANPKAVERERAGQA